MINIKEAGVEKFKILIIIIIKKKLYIALIKIIIYKILNDSRRKDKTYIRSNVFR